MKKLLKRLIILGILGCIGYVISTKVLCKEKTNNCGCGCSC